MDGAAMHSVNTTSSLPLTGILIVGQDQDGLDEGYTKDQSFLGQVTGLTLWQEDLRPQALHGWGACSLPDVSPLLSWNNMDWSLYNNTGTIMSHQNGPCSAGDGNEKKIFLFTDRRLPYDASTFLDKFDLDLCIPDKEEEYEAVSALLRSNNSACLLQVRAGYGAWLGIIYNDAEDIFTDINGRIISNISAEVVFSQGKCPAHVLHSDSGNWFTCTNVAKICYAGKQRNKTVVFSLRGFTKEAAGNLNVGESSLKFVLASSKAQGVYFLGVQQFHIKKQFNSSRWYLEGPETNQVAYITSVAPPIGRHDWVLIDDDESPLSIPLSLSRCSDREFPCSDGSCIDLDKLCNRVTECLDRSDEIGCATALLPSDYLEDILPAIPLPLYAEISLLKLTTFDILSMTFLAYLEIKLSWSDPQVTFAHLLPGIWKEVVTNSQKNVSCKRSCVGAF